MFIACVTIPLVFNKSLLPHQTDLEFNSANRVGFRNLRVYLCKFATFVEFNWKTQHIACSDAASVSD